ncbi:cupin domain-containing protein [Corynebacterium flavescens]|uniref:cupin domain-containing protein n=1 Tax=Corynebacterium flavescens TaxID=28028 RepID=UPI003FD6661B
MTLNTNTPETFGPAVEDYHEGFHFLDLLAQAPEVEPDKKRPAVKRVLRADGANLIVFSFAPGQDLPDHRAAHPITVSSLRGEFEFSCAGKTVTLSPGSAVQLRDHLVHRVDYPATAEGTGVLLLTMITGERITNAGSK